MTGRVPILVYHSIAEQASERFRPWALHPSVFEQHLQLLYDRGYTAVTVSTLLDAMSGRGPALPPDPVVLTFDDGYLDFHSHALPVLERHGFPSTLYVTTGYLGRSAGWLASEGEGDRRMLGWTELRDVADRGVELGAHSHTHPRLDELAVGAARDEILRSRQLLEEVLGVPVRSFAYPHGYHGSRVRRLVVDAGYEGAVAMRHAMSSLCDDRFGLARVIVYAGTSARDLDRLLHGDHLRQAPFPEEWRTTAWRVARRTRRSLDTAVRGGAGA